MVSVQFHLVWGLQVLYSLSSGLIASCPEPWGSTGPAGGESVEQEDRSSVPEDLPATLVLGWRILFPFSQLIFSL